jgi:mannose-6-phosphate isomerase-like protein (cupin superfamily)
MVVLVPQIEGSGTMEIKTNEPYVLPKGIGLHDVWFPYPTAVVGRYNIKTTSEQTRGRLSQVHVMDERGAASPMHIHRDYDETYYLIDGEMTFFVGDEQIGAEAGSYTFVPQGVRHCFLVRSERAEFLLTFAPAGLEGFFAEVGTPVGTGAALPEPRKVDPEDMNRRAGVYRVEFVGPPPTL